MAKPIAIAPSKYKLRTDLPPDPATGRRRQVSTIFSGSLTDAKLAQSAFEVRHKGPDHTGSSIICSELFARWLIHAEQTLEAQTVYDYRNTVRLYLDPHLGDIALRDIRPSHLDHMYRQLSTIGGRHHRGLAATTIKKIHHIACAAFTQAERWEWIDRNPAKLARPPKVRRGKKIATPDTAAVQTLLQHLRSYDYDVYVFVECAASLGARPGEVCAIRWLDVDWSAGTITIDASVTRFREVKSTKTDRERTVTVDDETLAMLKGYMPAAAPPEHYIFGGEVAWRPTRATMTIKRVRDAHGLPAITPRSLRHYVATRLIANGVDIRTVAGRLGHASPATTLNVYSAFVPEKDREAADLLRALRT